MISGSGSGSGSISAAAARRSASRRRNSSCDSGACVLVLVRRLDRLLHRERDAATLRLDVEDLHLHRVADGNDLGRRLDVTVRELRDVDEAFEPFADLDERAERHELGDLAVDDVAGSVAARERLPRVLLRRLQRQRDALALEVDVEDLDVDLLADLDDLGRILDVLPRQLRDVDEAVDPTEVDERAELHDRRHLAAPDLALLQGVEQLLARLGLRLLEEGAAREDDVVPVAVELDDLALELLSDEGVQVADAADVDERGGQEPAEADVDDQAALDDLDDRADDALAR